MPTSLELRDERARLIGEARSLNKRAEDESRALNAEEHAQFDKIMDAVDAKKAEIDRLERLERSESDLGESRGRKTNDASVGSEDRSRANESRPRTAAEHRATDKYFAAFEEFLLYGSKDMSDEARAQFREQRGMQADVNVQGGYITAPKKTRDELLKGVDDALYIRQWATVIDCSDSASLGVPTLDTDVADADWTPELSIGDETELGFGERELHPKDLSKLVKISLKLMRLATMGPEALVRQRLSYKFGVTQEKAFLTGNGLKQPLGVYTASNDGIPTTRDITCGSAAGDPISGDGLIDMKYGLKAQYLTDASLRWLFHRDGVKRVRKLKTVATGEYVWQPGLQKGEPDLILGIPYAMSEFNPNTYTQNAYPCLLGAFKNYWIADGPSLALQRLDELYATTNQVGFIARLAVDGQPVLAEAFVRGKVGA